MSRRWVSTGVMVFVLSSLSFAAGPWENTTFTGWSDQTLQELLADSPWAGQASLSRPRGNSSEAPLIPEKALVTWTTALPMRQALIRQAVGLNGPLNKDAEAFVSLNPNLYMVALQISGSPAAATYAAEAEEVRKETFLVRTDGRAPLEAQVVEGRALDKSGNVISGPVAAPIEGGSSVFVFQFSKGLALTMIDREVEFVTKVGNLTIKKKFKMKDMVYKGELAL